MDLNRNESKTIGTSAEVVSYKQEEPNERAVIFIVNTSAGGQVVSIGVDSEAIAGNGIVLQPGGYYQESRDSGFKPTQAQITAIASAAGATLSIHERITDNGI